jgi:hypothetical protein
LGDFETELGNYKKLEPPFPNNISHLELYIKHNKKNIYFFAKNHPKESFYLCTEKEVGFLSSDMEVYLLAKKDKNNYFDTKFVEYKIINNSIFFKMPDGVNQKTLRFHQHYYCDEVMLKAMNFTLCDFSYESISELKCGDMIQVIYDVTSNPKVFLIVENKQDSLICKTYDENVEQVKIAFDNIPYADSNQTFKTFIVITITHSSENLSIFSSILPAISKIS